MSPRPRRNAPRDDGSPDARSELERELERLSQETETDKLLESLETELRDWAPKDDEKEAEEVIDRLNRRLISRSVFRESLEAGYHEESLDMRPMESEVRKGLEELKKLIELGKQPPRK